MPATLRSLLSPGGPGTTPTRASQGDRVGGNTAAAPATPDHPPHDGAVGPFPSSSPSSASEDEPHISVSAVARRLSSPPRTSSDATFLRDGEAFWSLYELTGKILGVGGFALVYEAVCLRNQTWVDDQRWQFRVKQGQRVAVKVATTRRVDVTSIREEMELMRQLQHPNICSVVDPNLYCMAEPVNGRHRRNSIDHSNGSKNSNSSNNSNIEWRRGDRYFPPPTAGAYGASKREYERAQHRYREEQDRQPYVMVMSLCDEGSLYDYIMFGDPVTKPRSVAQAKRIFFDVLLGLQYLASKLIVHQDTKIDNLYLSSVRDEHGARVYHEDGSLAVVAKVGDLGLSRLVGGRGPSLLPPRAEMEAIGRFSCCHLSPDVRLGTRHPHYKDDLYSLGLAMFEFLTKERLTAEITVSIRATLRAYLRAKSGASGFQDFLPLLNRLLHEHRLLRPRIDELLGDPVFAERRAWLTARLADPSAAHELQLQRQMSSASSSSSSSSDAQGGSAAAGRAMPRRRSHRRRSARPPSIFALGRRDELEEDPCGGGGGGGRLDKFLGGGIVLYEKSRAEERGGGKLRATFSFEDLRDDLLLRSFQGRCHEGTDAAEAPPTNASVTLVVSASRDDWRTMNNRESSTCSAILEMETRPLPSASPGRQDSDGDSRWEVMEFGRVFQPATGHHRIRHPHDGSLFEVQRVDGRPLQTVDRLFLGLFDRPKRLTRLPVATPTRFYSWRSLWDLYQALRQAVHELAPPGAPVPAVIILPLLGLVLRRETGPSVFSSDDAARKFILQEMIGLVEYYANATTKAQLACVHIISWNQWTKDTVLRDGVHGVDGDAEAPTPTSLQEMLADALQDFGEAMTVSDGATEQGRPELARGLGAILMRPPTQKGQPRELTHADVVERCFDMALDLAASLPRYVLSPLADLAYGVGQAGGAPGGGSSTDRAAQVLEESRLHVEVIKYNELRRRYDVEQAQASSQHVTMTGSLEATRSAVALQHLLGLLVTNMSAVQWGPGPSAAGFPPRGTSSQPNCCCAIS